MGILKWNFLVERLLELNAAKAEVITMLSTILGALPAWPLGLLARSAMPRSRRAT